MALLFADGFESGTSAWALGSNSIGTGRFGNGMVTTTTSGYATLGLSPTSGPYIAGFAFKPAAAGAITSLFRPSTTLPHCGLSRGSGGEVTAFRSSNSIILGSSVTGVLPVGVWSYVEWKATISNSTGIMVVRVNGVEVLNLSGLDTLDTTSNTDTFVLGAAGGSGSSSGNAFDDVYLCDAIGSTNNDFLGELMVEHLAPASDDTAQWVGSDGNSTDNWDLVNEVGAYNSADYVASSTVGQRDLYVPVTSSRPVSNPVRGILVSAVAQKTDAGTRTAKITIKEGSGGTVRQSAELGLPTGFAELRAMWDRKADGSAWTVADVNALRFGIEVTA